MTAQRLHNLLLPLFRIGVLVTLCVAPIQWSFEVRPKSFLSLADLTLAVTTGVWLLDTLILRAWRRLLPPWPALLFVGFCAASAAVAADRMQALKEVVQYTEYFIVGYGVFSTYLEDKPRRAIRLALMALGVATALTLLLAGLQYTSPSNVDVLHVRGTFGNRNVLGGYLALALPILFGIASENRLRGVFRAIAVALLLAGLSLVLSGAAYFAIIGVILCMAAVRGAAYFFPVAAALLLWQVFALPHLPRENDIAHFQSLALYDAAGNVEKRYPEWQAAYAMALTHPWLGVGLGNYQRHIGQYYDRVPRRTGPSEPDTQNLYLVLAASAGLPALMAFLALLACAAQAARTSIRSSAHLPQREALACGLTGSLAAFSITAVWHPLLVRGIGLPLVFLLALAYHVAQPED